MDIASAQTALLNLLLDGHRDAANTLLAEWARNHGYRNALTQIMEPVLETIGERWSQDQLSLATGYIAGKVAEDVLLKSLEEIPDTEDAHTRKGPVILGNVEDDFHSLGRKLVSIFLQAAGWRVVDLGNDVSAAEFVDTAEREGAGIIGVSAMMFTTAANIRKIREELDRRNLSGKIKLAVGGAVFRIRPELAHEVGADGTAPTAVHAPALFSSLRDAAS